jgi:serine protease 16
LALEHRYYGVSHPFKNLTSENLRFLSSQQALHDLAYFIQKSSDLLDMPALAKAKWIIVGGSYPANLAAWFRQKFPHLVIGAWASSGPVLAKADYWEYDAVVGKQLGSKCAKVKAFKLTLRC